MRKRNIKTKQQKYKGSITIFAALSFMLIAQFIFTMLEVSRTIEVRKTLQMNTESVLESIFANYCSPLWEEYRLLGTSVVNSDGDLSFNNVQAQLQNLTEVNLGGREKSLLAGTSMLTAKMTDANFEELVNSGKPMVLDFWAEWCGPCRMVGPIIDELATEYEGRVTIGKMDVDNNNDVVAQFGIRNIPTVLFFKDGKMVDKVVGATAKDKFVEKIEAMLK